MNKIKAILFDMDGVLIDAKDWHYDALNEALSLFGLEISKYDHLHTFDGLPTKVKLQMLGEQYYLPEALHPLINQIKQQRTMEKIHTKCHPVYEHEYALSRLHHEGFKIAVCSNSIRRTIEEMMEYSHLDIYLDLIIANDDVTKAKPDPEMYTTAMSKLNLMPNECLVVEDNPNGIKAGLASGAEVLQVSSVYDVNYHNIIRKILACQGGRK